MANIPTVSAEERTKIRCGHTRYSKWTDAICTSCGETFPCPTIRLLDALEAAERALAPAPEVMTNAAGGAPVYVEGPSYPGGLHPSIPRLGISCACADCTAKRAARSSTPAEPPQGGQP